MKLKASIDHLRNEMFHMMNMVYMFNNAEIFNQPLNGWDVSRVLSMQYLFASQHFNQLVDGWDVSRVTDMPGMFYKATSFNQELNDWNLSSVIKIAHAFENAKSFNQSLAKWNQTIWVQCFLLQKTLINHFIRK